MLMKPISLAVAALLLTGCATSASTYSNLSPFRAIAAMATNHDREATSFTMGGMTDTITLQATALAATLKDVEAYCAKRPGKIRHWPNKQGAFSCLSPDGKIDFVVISTPTGFGSGVQIKVSERTEDNDEVFETMYLPLLGYRTDEQIMADQRKRMAEAQEERRKAEEAKLAQRKQNRGQVAYVGARVCQRVPVAIGGEAILIGTVEQVLGDQIKVFVERAVIAGAPGLSPGGFKQSYSTVYYWDVEPCQ
ncbi:MAG: hypothetical protein ITG07_02320 [Candidimonas sp.]|nr:hypothetical protein [Candidimonas sp.]